MSVGGGGGRSLTPHLPGSLSLHPFLSPSNPGRDPFSEIPLRAVLLYALQPLPVCGDRQTTIRAPPSTIIIHHFAGFPPNVTATGPFSSPLQMGHLTRLDRVAPLQVTTPMLSSMPATALQHFLFLYVKAFKCRPTHRQIEAFSSERLCDGPSAVVVGRNPKREYASPHLVPTASQEEAAADDDEEKGTEESGGKRCAGGGGASAFL